MIFLFCRDLEEAHLSHAFVDKASTGEVSARYPCAKGRLGWTPFCWQCALRRCELVKNAHLVFQYRMNYDILIFNIAVFIGAIFLLDWRREIY